LNNLELAMLLRVYIIRQQIRECKFFAGTKKGFTVLGSELPLCCTRNYIFSKEAIESWMHKPKFKGLLPVRVACGLVFFCEISVMDCDLVCCGLCVRIECRIVACCILESHWGEHSSFLSWSPLVFFQLCLLMGRQRVRILMMKNGCYNKIGGYRKKTMPQRTSQILLEKVTMVFSFINFMLSVMSEPAFVSCTWLWYFLWYMLQMWPWFLSLHLFLAHDCFTFYAIFCK